jgi:hypothetical protein
MKTEGAIINGQSRDTGIISNKTQNQKIIFTKVSYKYNENERKERGDV